MDNPDAVGWNELFNPSQAATGDSILPFLGLAQAVAARASVIAEVGCGRGSEAYAKRAPGIASIQDLRGPNRQVIGMDVDPVGVENPLIDEFRQISEDGRWPLNDSSVDFAVADWVLEHVVDPDAFVAELSRVLRPGGAFIARTPSRHSPLSLFARTVPNSKHGSVLAILQPRRETRDVFPTFYRMNSARTLRGLLDVNYDWSMSHRSDLREYFSRWPRAAQTITAVEPHLPQHLRSTLVIYARKR